MVKLSFFKECYFSDSIYPKKSIWYYLLVNESSYRFFPIFESMEGNTKMINKEEVEKLERIASILKTVAHPLRLGVVHLLEQHEELAVSQICEMLDSEQSLTSHHLQNMRLKGILRARRDGRSILYSLKEKDVSLLIECLGNCQCNM
ncbi:MAG: metalloregulator ArsR/SmtB family transcription factor [Saprospiraceae bacterium]